MIDPLIDEYKELKQQRKSIISSTKSIFSELKKDVKTIIENIKEKNEINLNEETAKLPFIIEKISSIEEKNYCKQYNNNINGFYSSLSKYGKSLSNVLEKEETLQPNIVKYNKDLFIKIFCKDLYRKGNFNSADSLILESKVQVDQNLKQLFKDLRNISIELKKFNLNPLEIWCIEYSAKLKEIESDLPFELKKYIFFTYLYDNNLSNTQILFKAKTLFADYLLITNKTNDKYKSQISEMLSLILIRNNDFFIEENDEKLPTLFFNLNFIEKNNMKLAKANDDIKISKKNISTQFINERFTLKNLINNLISKFNKDCCTFLSKIFI